jgi:EAL domain-containing protein (putative c-di-GMP-specific phosphodiesterase class I)
VEADDTGKFPKVRDPQRNLVLVVDDDPMLRRALERSLANIGFSVVTVADGEAAVEAIKGTSFDVVLTDIELPGPSGVDLLRVLRAYDLDVPVVIMTGKPSLETAIEAVELGALQYLVKPVATEVLERTLDRASKLHRIARLKRDALKFHGEAERQAGDRAGLIAAFERALRTLKVVFQPVVDVRKQKTMGYEALVRGGDPSLESPAMLLQTARRLGELPKLGRRIRVHVAADSADIPSDCLLFINVDPADLLDAALFNPDTAFSKLADRVVLEFTERMRLDEVKDAAARVSQLRSLGFRIGIDDFGAGFAGLQTFSVLEPDYVKVDMSLIRNIDASVVQQRLVENAVVLCRDLQTSVIAEGVETPEERDAVGRLGCDLMQGYLFGRPGPLTRPSSRSPKEG